MQYHVLFKRFDRLEATATSLMTTSKHLLLVLVLRLWVFLHVLAQVTGEFIMTGKGLIASSEAAFEQIFASVRRSVQTVARLHCKLLVAYLALKLLRLLLLDWLGLSLSLDCMC